MRFDGSLEIALDDGGDRRFGMAAKGFSDIELLACNQYLHGTNGSARRGFGGWQRKNSFPSKATL
jgi:hypothetical protein